MDISPDRAAFSAAEFRVIDASRKVGAPSDGIEWWNINFGPGRDCAVQPLIGRHSAR
jgi:hypothetical protein